MKNLNLYLLAIIASLAISCNSQSKNKTFSENKIQLVTTVQDTLIKIKANPLAGFNFDYLLYLPKGLNNNKKIHLLIETNNTGGVNDSISFHEKRAIRAAAVSSVGNYVSKKLSIPLLVPIFPRSETNWENYTHALDRDTFLSQDKDIKRLDLQLLAMIDDAKIQLNTQKLKIHEKYFIVGFSASGTFANRFSLLHPENIEATVSGGINAIPILPISTLKNKALDYPLGIADIEKVTKKPVNLKGFKALPKFLFMGALDTNDAVKFDDAYSNSERQIVFELMGEQLIPERWGFVEKIYQENMVNAIFKTYTNMGHGTDVKINDEITAFIKNHSK